MGFAKANNKKQECYYIYINNQPYTMVGVTYPSEPVDNLGDWLGILVSEQARFDTLRIFEDTFLTPETYRASRLFNVLFTNFKESIYNNWDQDWESKIIDVKTPNLVKPNINKFVVTKMLKKI
jgi:hypothetical protein